MIGKSIFIIPGYKHKPKNKAYKAIAKILKKQGYRPILINIPWRQTTISQNTKYFLKKYKKINAKEKYILGFSFGAMIAFLASTKVKTAGFILCSLSPYFQEDLLKKHRTGSRASLTELRYQDFSGLNCSILAKQIKTEQILMLYGAKEEKTLIRRVTQTYDLISSGHKYLIPIKETEHNIGDKRYLNEIQQITKQLN